MKQYCAKVTYRFGGGIIAIRDDGSVTYLHGDRLNGENRRGPWFQLSSDEQRQIRTCDFLRRVVCNLSGAMDGRYLGYDESYCYDEGANGC